MTTFFLEAVLPAGLVRADEAPFDNLAFNLLALFLWIKLVLAALSKAEYTADKLSGLWELRAFLIRLFKFSFLTLFRAVLTRSFLSFFIALLISGMRDIVT